MNCTKCNFPYMPADLKDGLCFNCTHEMLATVKDQLRCSEHDLKKWEEGCMANAKDAAEAHRVADHYRLALVAIRDYKITHEQPHNNAAFTILLHHSMWVRDRAILALQQTRKEDNDE